MVNARTVKKILISTMPRSSTVYFFNFIAELFNFKKIEPLFTMGMQPRPPEWNPYEFDETYLSLNDGEVLCAHYPLDEKVMSVADQVDVLSIYLYRDPRDVAVSAALYIKYALTHHAMHKVFSKMSDADAIAFMISGGVISSEDFPSNMEKTCDDYILYKGMSYFTEIAKMWLLNDKVAKVRYENFISDPVSLINSFNNVGVHIEEEQILRVLEKWNFKVASAGRSIGQEDKSSHFRKGIAGDYKNYFGELHRGLTKKEIGKDLIRLGYETSLSW